MDFQRRKYWYFMKVSYQVKPQRSDWHISQQALKHQIKEQQRRGVKALDYISYTSSL